MSLSRFEALVEEVVTVSSEQWNNVPPLGVHTG